MYLSKIEVIGFKSFAQRIEVSFDAGVTAIVGPNGCGKTNIVDAIRWALGEQRYSTLRSDKMEDVIFNGTKNRKPLGLAEVSLTIENTKGILPTEYSEVTITRRVFRSGESEYQLNKVPCRLKDILDLFMDTGMGSDAYSVIELKMVESILSDKTDERRRLFEEAAGVTKYKHRRKAAMRKLDDVQADLMRVNDIVKEVQKTVSTLERQAKKAEQYNEVAKKLKSLEIDLLEREFAYLHGKLRPLEQKFRGAHEDKSTIDQELRNLEEQSERLRKESAATEELLRDRQSQVSRQNDGIHQIEEKILVGNERRHALEANIERLGSEKVDLRHQEESLTSEVIALRERLRHLTGELAGAETEFARVREEFAAAGRAVEQKKTDTQAVRDTVLTIAHEIIRHKGEQERVKTRIDNLKGRIDRSVEDNTLYTGDIERNEALIAQLTAHDRDLRKQFAEAEIRLAEEEEAKQIHKQDIEELQKKLLETTHEVERRRSKIEFIRRMMEGNDGYSAGARYILTQDAWKQKNVRSIGDIVESAPKYRRAVEAVLADIAQMIVVDSVEDGYAAVADLQRQKHGNAAFICLDWIPSVRRRGTMAPGGAVRAAEVVECEPKYRQLLNFLLEDVLIVEDVDAVRKILGQYVGVRCVTLEGQTASGSGFLRGGESRQDEVGIIGKRSQITALEGEIAELEKRHATLLDEVKSRTADEEAMDTRSFRDAVKAIEKEMTSVEMRIAQLEFEKKRANDGIERNLNEVRQLEHEILGLRDEYEKMTSDLGELERRRSEEEELLHRSTRELEGLEAHLNDRTKAVNDLEIRVVTLQGESKAIERDRERAEERINDTSITLQRRDQEIARAREEVTRLGAEAETLQTDLTALKDGLAVLETETRTVQQRYQEQRNSIHQIELQVKDERRLHDDTTSAVHDLEMKTSELKSGIEHLRTRALEEFEFTLELREYPEDEWVDFAARREEVKALKERIRVLGAINFAAFDEFTAESERLSFLTQQRDDLIEAEKTLLNTIEEINTTAQRIFTETFLKIRENFITIFKELFLEGDECDLRIEENVDPLEANIEIIAKPRGKRPTSIDLLSGGEKTLTAIALLFAIYLVKPSPFCILDEVDAPLDDSNIDRFTRILKKFSNNTQFIVVTHNKRTMEAASALYGVTMEEEGISKIVTVRFNEEARIRSATVTN